MYSKIGRTQDAVLVFEEMPMRDAVSYNTMINGFGSNGFYEEVMMVFYQILKSGFLPNMESVSHAIMACGELKCMSMGLLIHCFVIQKGFYSDVAIVNSLISMYVKAGRLEIGRHIFYEMQKRDLVSWNSLITGYARNGDWFEAVDLFLTMQKVESFTPSPVTFLGLVIACGQARNLYMGESIHGLLIHMGLLSDFRLGTSIVDMYSKCGRVDCARSIFDVDLSERSLVSWNSLIAGYSQNGYDYDAVLLFEQMLLDTHVKPDSITIANVIPAYASLADLRSVSTVHGIVIKRGLELESDTVLGTAMVDAYGKCLDIESATSLFASMRKFNVATWNALISGYNLSQHANWGLSLFLEMLQSEVLPDSITMVMLFQSCGVFGSLKQGSMLHCHCLSRGFDSHITVGNAIIDMYMRFGGVTTSVVLFNIMPSKNVITWNTMLCGYVKNGLSTLALKLFHQMQLENHPKVDPVTMISIIQASTTISAGQGAEMMHGFALKIGFDSDTMVGNSLVDAYAKNGFIVNARSLFEQMGRSRDQSSWNTMIAGCGVNGQGEEACSLLFQMEEDGFKPNPITFISLLSSCSHSGLVKEGCSYFYLMMTKYGIQPSLEHWTCIIDMFGRAGRLEEAYQLIKYGFQCNLLSDCDAIWGALLSSCRENMNMELGTLAAEQLSRLAPQNCGYYTLLSNLYASVNRWDEAEKVRRVFDNGKLVKKPVFFLLDRLLMEPNFQASNYVGLKNTIFLTLHL
ncbi:pentatricopeptide repeat-containing protein DOT4, chloroplastic-like [Telopea speciosissima]|uniref:pentatricopeptide repeat-containing protein DOT4, chloroplastic-like n=1 Tax=Telopea speciosissima TaxID=54955 RepID=UPI001CC5A3F9|nr:pentatricopeptide repeat-containing protein DOT4, chloroplastic-like [Telopea speciosissima]